MSLSIKEKEKIICDVQKILNTACSAVIASLRGVTANEMNRLRKEARNDKVYLKVIPNSLLSRVLKKTAFECLLKLLTGQNVIAVSTRKASDAAHVCVKFSKNNEYFKITGAAFEGNFIGLDQINLLSSLPNHKESIYKLILILKTISVGNLIGTLQILINKKG